MWWLYMETMNGGLHQYFYNSTGDAALRTLDALKAISANKTYAILIDAIKIFDSAGGFTTNRSARLDTMSEISIAAFDETTSRFYDLDEDHPSTST